MSANEKQLVLSDRFGCLLILKKIQVYHFARKLMTLLTIYFKDD